MKFAWSCVFHSAEARLKAGLAMIRLQRTVSVLVLIVFLIVYSEANQDSAGRCNRSCGSGKDVPYPFGFSDGCPIRLNCSISTGEIKIGSFQVQNITPDGIVIELPAQCRRPIESLIPLFGPNYALASANSLLLQNCSPGWTNGCLIHSSPVSSQLNLSNCDNRDNLTCFSQDGNGVLRYGNLNETRCKYVFSSFAFGPRGDKVVELEFQRANLEWWIQGSCENNSVCVHNCSTVIVGNETVGYKCRCRDGFFGDGFAAGQGCRRESANCNASKYMTGECGGTTRVGALVGGLVAGALLMAGLAFVCYYLRRKSASLRNRLSAKRLLFQAAGNSSVPFFTYKEIDRATDSFSDKQRLGTGAYGTVYAGKLHNDEWVAIKKIRHRDTDSIDQVMNEIKLLSSVSHPNLVRLLGCCIEEGEQILVYEFMPNGTLCQHLQRERGKGLPWTIRLTIAAETASAIAYLHSAMNPPIYHRDIKSSNILLDYNYKSKVADFGLSRLGMVESSHISTAPQGTPGYLDPQYHQYFHLSDKSDVYSFGVVLVEIITALKVVDFSRPHSEVNLAALAIDRIGRGCVDEIIDPYLDPHRDAWTLSSIHNVAELAFRCLAFHRDMRPTMKEVAEELETIRLSAWVPSMYTTSPAASFCSSENGSEKSVGDTSSKKAGVASRRLQVPQRAADCLTTLEEVKDSSPVSVHDPWSSEKSSPSTNSLLDNVVQ